MLSMMSFDCGYECSLSLVVTVGMCVGEEFIHSKGYYKKKYKEVVALTVAGASRNRITLKT